MGEFVPSGLGRRFGACRDKYPANMLPSVWVRSRYLKPGPLYIILIIVPASVAQSRPIKMQAASEGSNVSFGGREGTGEEEDVGAGAYLLLTYMTWRRTA